MFKYMKMILHSYCFLVNLIISTLPTRIATLGLAVLNSAKNKDFRVIAY